MLVRVVVLVFGVIQALLSLRLLMDFASLPREIERYGPLLIDVTDPLIAPFRGFTGSELPVPVPGRIDTAVVVALVGWTIVEGVVVLVARALSGRDGGRA